MPLLGRVVLDASVVVEAVAQLAHSVAARAILRDAASGVDVELWSPDLVYPESTSAIRNLLLRGDIDRPQADVAVERIIRLPLLVLGTRNLIDEAWTLTDNVTVYDACYAVLARQLGATMVTADARLVRALQDPSVFHIDDID